MKNIKAMLLFWVIVIALGVGVYQYAVSQEAQASAQTATEQNTATSRQVVNPPGIAPLVPAYSVGIRDGDMVYVSGIVGVKPGSQDIVDGGVGPQTRQTLENIRTTLVTAGATMADVNECTVFLVDMADYAAMNAVYVEFFRVDPRAGHTGCGGVTQAGRPRRDQVQRTNQKTVNSDG